MKNNILFFILIFLFSALNIQALIIESNKLATVIDYISPGTLIIFDIDNTLAHPTEELSSDEWFCHLVNKRMLQGHDYITSIYYALPVTYYAQFNVDLEPTESIVSFLIAQLIAYNIPTMALSTRSLFVAERTIEQLENINVQFLVPHMSQDDLVLSMAYPCFYKNSILFGGNNDKGEALLCLFDTMNYYPKKVIFVDDKMKYIESVEKALQSYNISFVGIRYSGCDERVHNFDPEKAETQWRSLRQKKELS